MVQLLLACSFTKVCFFLWFFYSTLLQPSINKYFFCNMLRLFLSVPFLAMDCATNICTADRRDLRKYFDHLSVYLYQEYSSGGILTEIWNQVLSNISLASSFYRSSLLSSFEWTSSCLYVVYRCYGMRTSYSSGDI